ncbi:MAG: tyrosine-type recombinase/integrase [Magnetospiraceae bacterium]
MPKVTLTDITVRSLKTPEKGQTTYVDKSLPGFGVRVSQGGTKTYTLTYGANRQRVSIGKCDVISLAEARASARQLLAEHTLGKTRPTSINFQDAVDRYIAECEQKNKPTTVREYKRVLNRHFRLGRVQLRDVKKQDLTNRIDKLRKTPAEQNYAFVVARAFFRWAVRHGYLDRSPLENLRMPARTQSRSRVLSDDELAAVFKHALETPYPFGPIVALLILTGQRRGEIVALRWEWIDREHKIITLPATLTKNRREHAFPYGEKTAEILDGIPEQGDLLFPARTTQVRGKPSTYFNGWSSAKKAFDEGLENVAPYTLHDLRRTFSSKLAGMGTQIHVTEKLLNHVSGTVSGVAAVYNRHSYMEEMRDAVEGLDTILIKSSL